MLLTDRLPVGSQRKYTDEGFLQVPATIARTGIYTYTALEMGLTDRDPNDIIKVYRPPEEVFDKTSLDSFANKPVTDNHPPELVTAKNAKNYAVGWSANEVTHDETHVKTHINVMDSTAIRNVESGKSELSNGYVADIEWTPGVSPDGVNYDAIQRKIRGNHIAIVERGRAGSSCRIADKSPENGDVKMTQITIDGVDYEVSDQAAQAVKKMQKTHADAMEKTQKELDELEKKKKAEADENKEKMDSLEAKLDDAKTKILSDSDIDAMIEDRLTVIDNARKLVKNFDAKGKSNKEIMSEVVADKSPGVQLDSKSDEYIKARFDLLVEQLDSSSSDDLDNTFRKNVKDSQNEEHETTLSLSDAARQKFIEKNKTLYKSKTQE